MASLYPPPPAALTGQRSAATAPTTAAVPPARLWTRRRLAAVIGGYIVGLVGMLLWKGVFLSADRYVLILLVPAIVLGIARPYVRDFVPFVALVLLYEEARGLAHTLRPDPYVTPPLDGDRLLFFGHQPVIVLQDLLWQGHLMWYDHGFALIQRAHFIVPPTLLFLIWLENRQLFYRCAATLIAVSFAAALIFLIFPAAPPWRASELGLLPEVARVGYEQASASPLPTGKSWLESQILPNPYAAVPSLHTAYSLLTLVFALAWRRRVGYAFIAYPLVMWFTIVYFADHYVVDILAGGTLALIGWFGINLLIRPGRVLGFLAGPFPAPLSLARTFGGSR